MRFNQITDEYFRVYERNSPSKQLIVNSLVKALVTNSCKLLRKMRLKVMMINTKFSISDFMSMNCVNKKYEQNTYFKRGDTEYNLYIYTVEPRYPDTRFSHHSAYHVSFSKSRFSTYDFNANKLRILGH